MDRSCDDVRAFLADPVTYGATGPVARIETHAATVFLVGDRALKIKKPVKFPFLDYSTLELRARAITREYAVNRPNAPDVYRGVLAVVRLPGGGLALVPAAEILPAAEPIEWVLDMARFDEAATLDRLAEKPLPPTLVDALAEAVVKAETRAPIRVAAPWIADLRDYIAQNDDAFRTMPDVFPLADVSRLRAAAEVRFATIEPLLRARGAAGLVRLTHGDLHTGNIAVINGRPVLFDAIEFDDRIATGDILYDAGFLIMDLDERGRRIEANRFLNGWIMATARGAGHGEAFAERLKHEARGLQALPFFLMMRAAIRAKVTAAKAADLPPDAAYAARTEARRYFDMAIRDLDVAPLVLVAIGGLSGTGKSTLARGLAPLLGHPPGALHLRSDQIRKGLAGVGDAERLPDDSYTPEASRAVYKTVLATAEAALSAGCSVILDTVAARPEERTTFATIAASVGARFVGLWLEAPADVLTARVTARTGDASDADARVVAQQAGYETGTIDWTRVDASGTAEETFARAREAFHTTLPRIKGRC